MKTMRFRWFTCVLCVVVAHAATVPEAIAQNATYKPGDKIEYKASRYPEVWEEGVFVGATPDGSQPIIREKPNQFYKDGFQRASQWSDIRPLTKKGTPPDPQKDDTQTKDSEKDEKAKDEKTKKDDTPAPDAPKDGGGGLMTQAEILSFLRTRLGDDPFGNPRREEIKKELAAMIKRRGVNFRYETLSDFGKQISKFGMTSEVTFPLTDNYGPPTKQSWLMGAWSLSKIGATVDYERNNSLYRQNEIGVKGLGTLTINPNGTYVWQSTVPAGVVRGKWRKASTDEMKYQGGDGIVLLKAKSGWDWIVMQDRTATIKGDWLSISELGTRQVREFGLRQGGKK